MPISCSLRHLPAAMVDVVGSKHLTAPIAHMNQPGHCQVRVLLCRRRPQLVPATGQGLPQVVPCQLSELAALSSVRIYISKDLRPLESRQLGVKVGGSADSQPWVADEQQRLPSVAGLKAHRCTACSLAGRLPATPHTCLHA